MTNIYLIRHGETEWNRVRRFQGHGDSPLTEKGIGDVQAISRLVRSMEFDRTYCSPLGRTRATLSYLKPDADQVVFDDRLKEISLGILEGKYVNDLPEDLKKHSDNFWKKPEKFRVSGSESFSEVEVRVRSFLEDLSGNLRSVLAVTHTVVIKMFLSIAEDKPVSEIWSGPYIHPGSLIKLKKENSSLNWELMINPGRLKEFKDRNIP